MPRMIDTVVTWALAIFGVYIPMAFGLAFGGVVLLTVKHPYIALWVLLVGAYALIR